MMATSALSVLKSKPVSLTSIPTAGPELASFLNQLITESFAFISGLTSPPQAPWKSIGKKSYGHGEAVELLSYDNHLSDGQTEYWFARRSLHELEGDKHGSKPGKGLKYEEFI